MTIYGALIVNALLTAALAAIVFFIWLASRKRIAAETIGRAEEQALRIALKGKVRSLQGVELSVDAATICIHGDSPNAAATAAAVAKRLREAGVELSCAYRNGG